MPIPVIEVVKDYDGYFESFVKRMVREKEGEGGTFNHTKIVIVSGPYRMSAVSYTSEGGIFTLDFYSALRTGFGSLSEQDIKELKDLL